MKRIVSSIIFAAIFLGFGALIFLSFPGGAGDAVTQVDSSEADVVAGAPAAVPATSGAAASGKLNAISVVLDNGITTAADLKTDIDATTGTTTTAILKYDPIGGFTKYDPALIFIFPSYPISPGMPLLIQSQGTSTDTYTFVGDVPAQGSIDYDLEYVSGSCTQNFISLPLDQGSITMASELAADIGDVSTVSYYDPDLGFVKYDPTLIFIFPDFPVSIGYPYFVCVTASKTWPTP